MNEFKELFNLFKRIKSCGWIEEKRRGPTGIGYTFECLLNKEADEFPLPDYDGIEIKTMNSHSKWKKLHLFTLVPDGDYLFPIKRVLEQLGYETNNNPWKKVCYRSFSGKEYVSMTYGRKGKLFVNWNEEKVMLKIFDYQGKDTDIGISWSFELLRERINLKLKKLAIIRASSRIINNKGYFFYNKINFYKLKDFETFLKLIEEGFIFVTFKVISVNGRIKDSGTAFSINIDDVGLLYDEILF